MTDQIAYKQSAQLVVVSGFAGSGKGTVVHRLMDRHPGYTLSISATTRDPRPTERDGIDYFFRTREQFEEMIREDAFLEYARYVDNYYGTPKDYVDKKLAEGLHVILEIETQGALNIKARRPDACMVFLTPPSAKELLARLTGRGTESADVVKRRMQQAAVEAEVMSAYDYILVNDEVDETADTLHAIVQAASHSAKAQDALIARMHRELIEINQS